MSINQAAAVENNPPLMRLGNFTLLPTGIERSNTSVAAASERDWQDLGKWLGGCQKKGTDCQKWWIADWIKYGQAAWGKTYEEAALLLDVEQGTLRNLAWVGTVFDSSCRHDNLPFSFHQEVAPLEPEQREELLTRASSEKLTRKQLRQEVSALRRRENEIQPPDFSVFIEAEVVGAWLRQRYRTWPDEVKPGFATFLRNRADEFDEFEDEEDGDLDDEGR